MPSTGRKAGPVTRFDTGVTLCRLVIFDLDGTLVDSLGDLADSMNAVLRSADYPEHPRVRYRTYVGDGMVNLVRRALPAEMVNDETVAEFVKRMSDEYARRCLDSTAPFPRIPELLQNLRERGVKTAVLSNKPDEATQAVVNRFFAHHPFDVIRGALPGVPLKPDPTSALEVIRDCGVGPRDTLYVGDTDTDMKTGRNAGLFTVGVTWGFRDAAELDVSGAHRIVDHPLDLLSLCLGAKD